MSTPPADISRRRRYDKYRCKKKKETSGRFKQSFSKATVLPRITGKRLTTGYNITGAVITQNHSRPPKGSKVGKKGSVDFDLQCLVQEAKRKGVPVQHYSTSTCTLSVESHDLSDYIDSPPDNDKKNNKVKKNCSRATLAPPVNNRTVPSSSSSENNVPSFDTDHHTTEDIMYMGRTSTKIPSNVIYQGSSTPPSAKLSRPYSLSAYSKFAAGIVEALAPESKRQCSQSSLLSENVQYLNHIFKKTHNKVGILEESTPCAQERELTKIKTAALSKVRNVINSNVEKSEREPCVLPETIFQPCSVGKGSKNMEEIKTFKERNVEAWVRAIPEKVGLSSEHEGDQREKNVKFKSEIFNNSETEREFLKNVKKKTVCKPLHANPFTSTTISIWDKMQARNPEQSPVMSPLREYPQVRVNHDYNSKGMQELIGPSCKLVPKSDHEWLKRHSESKHEKNKASWKTCGFDHVKFYSMQKSQQPWNSWFLAGNENGSSGFNKLESFECLSPSPAFDPKSSKDNGHKAHVNVKRHYNRCLERPSGWSQFPKLCKTERNKDFAFEDKSIIHTDERSDTKQFINLECIKFSPRKMF